MKKVAILVADGFEEVEVITPVDFLRRAGIEVIITSIGALNVTGCHNIVIHADTTLDALGDDLDGIILPGGMPGASNLAQSEMLIAFIRKMNNSNKLLAAICAAPALVLGKARLLNGRQFTCYPGFEKKITGANFRTESVVLDGNILTSRGPGTAAEFAILIIEYLLGIDAANAVKQGTLQNW
ncbi:DJ-1 family protein [Psychromonas sp. MB-3u-54]|uniref:DJ-1 family glyoxalase III n=1 Tax=Psychromonas sp. MB-3u-54 TaxID=2058319 RepID=UPI000C334E1B|nr:DJ-1 family glyoxalase III [Psychromonas sp. MB-3u-54]PKH04109.1 DJ-1 family protein [Psychromonas sp. MB-3u-54]